LADTPIYLDTLIDTRINPSAELGSFAWADFEWVWAYGHLCQGCGYPRYEGVHGMWSPYGGCV
jgi:hypothetical protein